MATWGPSRKRDQQALPPAGGKAPAARSGTPKGTGAAGARNVTRARYSEDPNAPGTKSTRREQATGELKRAFAGKEHDFWGLVLIVIAVIMALGVYGNVAGPLSSAIEWVVAFLAGLGRYLVPPLLVVLGIVLIRDGRSSSPWRLVFGWTFVGLAGLGLLHIAKGPEGFSVDGVSDAGGVVGWMVGEPLRTLLADVGSVVLLLGALLVGVMLITQASLRTMASGTGRGVSFVAVPIGRAAQRALKEISSLRSDDEPDDDAAVAGAAGAAATPLALGPAGPYDAGNDFDDDPTVADDTADRAADAGAGGGCGRRRRPRPTTTRRRARGRCPP